MSLAAAALCLSAMPSKGTPHWYDNMLAGYAFTSDERHGAISVHDARTGFWLVRDVECDGAFLTLLLTRDRTEAKEVGVTEEVAKKLPNLSTGKGLTIGDPVATVRERLGRPTATKRSGSRNQFVELHYKWNEGGDPPEIDEQVYTFRAGRLIQIEFSRGND